jgi:hypothetical protein
LVKYSKRVSFSLAQDRIHFFSEQLVAASYAGTRRKQTRKSDAMRGTEVRALKALFQSLCVLRLTKSGAAIAP